MPEPIKSEDKPTLRDERGFFQKGTAAGPGRKPGQTLKEYVAKKFREMTDDEKEAFLGNVGFETIWRMGEGMPKQDTELSGTIKVEKPIYAGKSIQGHDSNSEDIQTG